MLNYSPGRLDLGDTTVPVDDVVYAWHKAFLDEDRCFLCGRRLNPAIRTTEHVVPKWLQRRHDLWDEGITLVNGSHLAYRNATVPACIDCNTGPLNDLETEISTAFAGGRRGVQGLPPKRLWQWLLKLSYGLIRIEHRLPEDRSKPNAGVILDLGCVPPGGVSACDPRRAVGGDVDACLAVRQPAGCLVPAAL